jgi:hypothetical protein
MTIQKKKNNKTISMDNSSQIKGLESFSIKKCSNNNKSNSYKYISTKNSTNSRADIKINDHTSKFLLNQSTKVNEFNDNIYPFPSEIEKIDKRKKRIKFISNFGNNGNSILSLILSKNNNNNNGRNKKTNNLFFDLYQKKSKSLVKSGFKKNIFFNNIHQSINILKYIFHKDNMKKPIKSHDEQYLQNNRKFSGLMNDKISNYVNNLKAKKININISI